MLLWTFLSEMRGNAFFDIGICHICHTNLVFSVPKASILSVVFAVNSAQTKGQNRSFFAFAKAFLCPLTSKVWQKVWQKNSPAEFVETRILSGFLALRPKHYCFIFRPQPSLLRNLDVYMCLLSSGNPRAPWSFWRSSTGRLLSENRCRGFFGLYRKVSGRVLRRSPSEEYSPLSFSSFR